MFVKWTYWYFPDLCAYTGMSWNKYHRYTVIDNFVKCLAAEYPDKAQRFQIGTSYEGRKMNLLRISNNLRSVKRAVWIDGGIHAREWASLKNFVRSGNVLLLVFLIQILKFIFRQVRVPLPIWWTNCCKIPISIPIFSTNMTSTSCHWLILTGNFLPSYLFLYIFFLIWFLQWNSWNPASYSKLAILFRSIELYLSWFEVWEIPLCQLKNCYVILKNQALLNLRR